jgi:hypothetical protein
MQGGQRRRGGDQPPPAEGGHQKKGASGPTSDPGACWTAGQPRLRRAVAGLPEDDRPPVENQVTPSEGPVVCLLQTGSSRGPRQSDTTPTDLSRQHDARRHFQVKTQLQSQAAQEALRSSQSNQCTLLVHAPGRTQLGCAVSISLVRSLASASGFVWAWAWPVASYQPLQVRSAGLRIQ